MASTESFKQLFENSLKSIEMRPGSIIYATVIEVQPECVILNAGLKSEAIVPKEQFGDEDIAVGDSVEVVIETLENGFGETKLSREKAKRAKAWTILEKLYQNDEPVTGKITEQVKGGFTVDLGSVNAFLPGSLIDIKPVRNPSYLGGKECELKIIKMDAKRNNIVVSRRAVLESESDAERQAKLDELQEGQEVMGVVKNVTDYGAFVDLGGIDGLLHITDMAWKRVRYPAELLKVGDEIKVKILKFDREKNRVSLGVKQLYEDPWANISRRYPYNSRAFGHVTNVTDYGGFVELEEGVEGLVHMSEMDWTNKNIHPSKVVQPGEEVEVVILDIDEERRRISLGMKQCKSNPWQDFSEQHQVGEKIHGEIHSITDFGIFIGLDGGIDGLVHLSDLSWDQPGEKMVTKFNKGDMVDAIILAVDSERERISLGIKQLDGDPIGSFLKQNDKNALIKATVLEVESKKALLQLSDKVEGVLRIEEYDHEHTDDLKDEIKPGDNLNVKIINIDRKANIIFVSHKVLQPTIKERIKKANIASKATLGDLLKQQMNNDD